jgi:hypothetical protein
MLYFDSSNEFIQAFQVTRSCFDCSQKQYLGEYIFFQVQGWETISLIY